MSSSYSLESLAALPKVRAPKQARSQKTITRILKAFDALLEQKPLDRITVAEVARRARASIPSLYARFDGKEALLVAAHETFKEETIASMSEFFAPERWNGVAVDEIARRTAADLVRLYQTRRNLLRAVLLSDSPIIYERFALLARHLSEQLAALLIPRLEVAETRPAEEGIDFGVRAALALLQHQLLFGAAHPARFDLSRRQLVPRIAELLIGFIPSTGRGAPGSKASA
jgi:AcrR family transcriptional regulator